MPTASLKDSKNAFTQLVRYHAQGLEILQTQVLYLIITW